MPQYAPFRIAPCLAWRCIETCAGVQSHQSHATRWSVQTGSPPVGPLAYAAAVAPSCSALFLGCHSTSNLVILSLEGISPDTIWWSRATKSSAGKFLAGPSATRGVGGAPRTPPRPGGLPHPGRPPVLSRFAPAFQNDYTFESRFAPISKTNNTCLSRFPQLF